MPLRAKGNTRRVVMPEFWKKQYIDDVPEGFKEFVYNQYFDNNNLYIYCDGSASKEMREMAIAVSILERGTVTVKQQLLFPPEECYYKPIYAEMKAILFALSIFKKLMREYCDQVVIYSDVSNIEDYLTNEKTFRNQSLKNLQKELIETSQRVKSENKHFSIDIKYLAMSEKLYNPFMKSAHNAARDMLRKLR